MKRKQNKTPGNRFSLSSSDVAAIICALPLVAGANVGDFVQAARNRAACDSAAAKLNGGVGGFSREELRVMYVAVDFALDVISGAGNAYISPDSIDGEWRAELSGHLFSYNRLRPYFSGLFPDA